MIIWSIDNSQRLSLAGRASVWCAILMVGPQMPQTYPDDHVAGTAEDVALLHCLIKVISE